MGRENRSASTTSEDSPQDLVEKFCAGLAIQSLNKRTIKNYEDDVQGLLEWLVNSRRWPLDKREIRESDLRFFKKHLATRFRPSTVMRKLASAKAFLAWAASQGLLQHNRERENAAVRISESTQYIQPERLAKFLAAVEKYGSAQERLIVLLLAKAGIRVSEICALRWNDVDVASDFVQLRMGTAERHKTQTCLLKDVTRLFAELKEGTDHENHKLVFASSSHPLTHSSLQVMIKRFGRIAGEHVTPKALRRTYFRSIEEVAVQPTRPGHRELQELAKVYGLKMPSRRVMPQPNVWNTKRLIVPDDTYLDIWLPRYEGTVAGSQSALLISRSGYPCDPLIRYIVLQNANGTCERCGQTFENPRLLQVHHIVSAGENCDKFSNCVALCPNCHTLAHYSPKFAEIEAELLRFIRSGRVSSFLGHHRG
jgi:integrase